MENERNEMMTVPMCQLGRLCRVLFSILPPSNK